MPDKSPPHPLPPKEFSPIESVTRNPLLSSPRASVTSKAQWINKADHGTADKGDRSVPGDWQAYSTQAGQPTASLHPEKLSARQGGLERSDPEEGQREEC